MSSTVIGDLTDVQVAEFKEAFNLFDRDGDGAISTDEVGTVMRSLGLHPTQKDVQDLLASLDLEGGQIDVNDFMSIMARQIADKAPPTEESLREAFRIFTGPEQGSSIAIDTLKNILTNHGEAMTEEEVAELLEEAGYTKPGQDIETVDFNELVYTLLNK